MANAAIAYENLADAATVTAQTAASLMPVTRVQNEHVRRRWRSTANSAWLLCDLLANTAIDTIGLFGLTLASGATIRIRVSTSAGGATSGDLLDVTVDTSDAEFDENYGALVYLCAAALTGRYVRFDITDSAASYVEAGRLFVGNRTEFTYKYGPGSSRGWTDPSARQKTLGGQTLIDDRPPYRFLDLSFDWVTEAQRDGLVETIDRVNGRRVDVLLIENTESTNLPMHSVWGLVTELTPAVATAIPDIFSKQYRVEERL